MSVVVEPTFIHHRRLQRILAGVAEGWMADIVREAQRLGQILVEPERSRDRPPDLRDFEAVRQPDAKMVAVGRKENLRLVTQPAETDRMADPIAIALEGVRGAARLLSSPLKNRNTAR